jgi:hypothetical protein
LIGGVLLAPSLAHVLWNASPPVLSTSAPVLVVSGVLVGFGAGWVLAARAAMASAASRAFRRAHWRLIFMGAGFATVFFVRHVLA